jgi:crotonobetainyl-CoA:carnitine CoA-transferase CaiB-like acyl-CoA transferase
MPRRPNASSQPFGEHIPSSLLPRMELGRGFDLLEGVRVLDLTTSVAGPFATLLLGDLGCEIIKIEHPDGGDDARAWGPPFLDGESLWFLSVNRNKDSLTLDYASEEGRAVLRDLVLESDVVVVNRPPRSTAKLGIDVATLTTLKPDVIYVSITGFGLTGDRSDLACYDLIAEGYSGVMDVTGEVDGPPQKIGTPAADMLAGGDAALATVAALYARARTGRGRVIDVSLVESMTRFLTCRITSYLGSGEIPRRSGAKDSVIAIYQAFETADEPLTLGLGTDAIWTRFWESVGNSAYGADPAYASNARRRAARAAIVEEIQRILHQKPRAEWLALFRAARIPAGPINRIDQTTADPHLTARGLLYRLVDEEREIPQVGTGFQLDGAANVPRRAPPRLGEATQAVLKSLLGYTDDQIRALKAGGII